MQVEGLPESFHEADTKTIRRMLDSLEERRQLQPVRHVLVRAHKQSLGVAHERAISVYVPVGRVRAPCAELLQFGARTFARHAFVHAPARPPRFCLAPFRHQRDRGTHLLVPGPGPQFSMCLCLDGRDRFT
jgi:hypothetical protein